MVNRSNRMTGFTLVEILIVVIILGILAAIVIPQFTNASEDAKGSNLISQLQTLRSQLELYQLHHNGDYPDTATWDQLRMCTDIDGNTNATKTVLFKFGPYLQQEPGNPFNGLTVVGGTPDDATPTAAAATMGWVWENGIIYATMPALKYADVFPDGNPNVRTY